jgi:flap endonuclease-1
MGIKGINKLIKSKNENYEEIIKISDFSGFKIAIDSNNWIYTNASTARKKVVEKIDVVTEEVSPIDVRFEICNLITNFIFLLSRYNILPIFIFDGKQTVGKEETRQKRRDSKLKHKQNIEELKKKLNENILEMDQKLVEKLRKEIINYNHVNFEEIDFFKTFISQMGFPVINSETEGEKLCSSLCIEKQVSGVFSTDTDNMVYGCPLYIKKIIFSNEPMFVCVILENVLKTLELQYEEFVDLCVLCGSDYNNNVKNVGPVRSLQFIKKYKSIDELSDIIDLRSLDHVKTREHFCFVKSKHQTLEKIKLNFEYINSEEKNLFIEQFNLYSFVSKIENETKVLDCKNGHIKRLNNHESYKYKSPKSFIVYF